MSISDIFRTMIEATTLIKAKSAFKSLPPETRDCLSAQLEKTARKYPNRTAVIFEGKTLTWRELNAMGNQYARALLELGLRRGDTASIFMENRIEFLASFIALNKLGVTAALINTNLTAKPLVHCLNITNSRFCVFGEERLEAVAEVRKDPACESIDQFFFVADTSQTAPPEWSADLSTLARGRDISDVEETSLNTLRDTALYIFTSGTTGLPKASIISNRRMLLSARLGHVIGMQCNEQDCIYVCLPLYHSTGLFVGFGTAISSGARVLLRRKFSASEFLPDVRRHGVTCFAYIGELCRYLLSTSQAVDDASSTLVTIMGNGLRPDVWKPFKSRFGIKRISEFYASSEGNVAFVNMLNKDCTVGLTPNPIALVEYDVQSDEIVKDAEGRVKRAIDGEPGLLLGQITETSAFDGYTNKEETEKKILRDVFSEGDAWFNTGDLVKTVDVGFSLGMAHYQFVDRVGDTYRWRSENVSTNEVGEIVCGHPQVQLCNVYGVEVPGVEGKAGMAALVLAEGEDSLDLESISDWVNESLPSYARPVFLRIQTNMETTGTFKMLKGDLRSQGYDLNKVSDRVFVMKPGKTQYETLDGAFHSIILSGQAGY